MQKRRSGGEGERRRAAGRPPPTKNCATARSSDPISPLLQVIRPSLSTLSRYVHIYKLNPAFPFESNNNNNNNNNIIKDNKGYCAINNKPFFFVKIASTYITSRTPPTSSTMFWCIPRSSLPLSAASLRHQPLSRLSPNLFVSGWVHLVELAQLDNLVDESVLKGFLSAHEIVPV